MNFTQKQLEILNFVREYNLKHGYAPTYIEMAKFFNKSTITIFEHLEALERKGAIKRRRHEARSVEILVDSGKSFMERDGITYESLGEGVIQDTNEVVLVLRRLSDYKLIIQKIKIPEKPI